MARKPQRPLNPWEREGRRVKGKLDEISQAVGDDALFALIHRAYYAGQAVGAGTQWHLRDESARLNGNRDQGLRHEKYAVERMRAAVRDLEECLEIAKNRVEGVVA